MGVLTSTKYLIPKSSFDWQRWVMVEGQLKHGLKVEVLGLKG